MDFTDRRTDAYRLMKLQDEKNVAQARGGIVFKNLKVCGTGSAINVQKNVGSILLAPFRFREFFGKGPEKTILQNFDGVLKSGEMLVVLGRPGSGCSTFLKTLMGELHGLDLKKESTIHYNGEHQQLKIPSNQANLVRHPTGTDASSIQTIYRLQLRTGSAFPSSNSRRNFGICCSCPHPSRAVSRRIVKVDFRFLAEGIYR